jgi:NAD(P)-dependent dehydrogenase (short-subunit alcohol dehydrogenase family)
MEAPKRFDRKVAVVTGAARGIGRAIALALGREGAQVALADTATAELRAAAREVESKGVAAIAVTCDVRNKSSVVRLRDLARERLGVVDFLVNCAGIYPVAPFLELTEEVWDDIIDTNLKGSFLCCQVLAQEIIRTNTPGRIVNISSTASSIARPGIAPYAASKAGINQLTRVLAIELAPHQIAVNAVCPGVIGTEHVQHLAQDPRGVAESQTKLLHIPLGRLGTPEEVVASVLFLLSAEASYVTGSIVYVDGGYSCGIPAYTISSPTA